MKRLLFFLVALVFAAPSFSQTDFCLPGARWMYYRLGNGISFEYQSNIIYQADTVILGVAAKVLKQEVRINYPWGQSGYGEFRSFCSQSSDSLFQYVDGNFKFMFDFDVQAGDTRVVYIGGGLCSEHDTMLIEATGWMNYQGIDLRTYDYRILIDDQFSQIEGGGYSGVSAGRYVERIGLLIDHPVNNRFDCDGSLVSEYMPADFVCYTDNELAVNFPDTCNLFLEAPSHPIAPTQLTITQNQLQVQNAFNSVLTVYDILGKQLFQGRVGLTNGMFDIGHLPNGILMVVLEDGNTRKAQKVVKTGL